MHIGSFRALAQILCWPISSSFDNEDEEKYRTALDAWVASGEPCDKHDEAGRILWDAFKRKTDYVNVSGLGLKTWPPLPPVRMVDISNNALTKAPAHWPVSLEKIIASHNRMTEVMALPPFVRHIDFSNNAIEKIDDLSGLKYINLHSNKLQAVPRLSNLAEEIHLGDNPLVDVLDEEWPDGCQFFLNGDAKRNVTVRGTLREYPELSWQTREKWCDIFGGDEEKSARKFFMFLEKFGAALKIKAEEMGPGLTIWLERLANCNRLREEIFGLAIAGLKSFKDGGLPTFRQMESALARDDVGRESGDGSPPWYQNGAFLKNVAVRRTLPLYQLSSRAREKWCEISLVEKENSKKFSAFIEKFRKAFDIETEELRPDFTIWLERLANCDTLRREIFGLAIAGLKSFEDGGLPTFRQMESALARDDVGRDSYDKALPWLPSGEFLKNAMVRRILPEYRGLSWKAREKWGEILDGGEKKNAEQFFVYLEMLRDALKMAPGEFRRGVTIWLERLARRNADTLREETFALGISGIGYCEDRVLVEFKQMATALIRDDIRNGEFKNLRELIAMARETFRYEELRNFSAELGDVLESEEGLEIELRFILGLRKRLGFNTQVRNMRYSELEVLKNLDFDAAEDWVQIAENERFPAWLATWPAWNDAVQRLAPGLFEKAEDEWQDRLALWLENAKREIDAGIKISNDVQFFRETNDMTDKFMQEARGKRDAAVVKRHGCADELKPLWNLKTRKAVRAQIAPRERLLHMLGTRF